MTARARILFLADTHLGLDEPRRPRVERRRRGPDFFANYERTLAEAGSGSVDVVVHGGDLFFRSRIPASLVIRAFRPLMDLADRGLPVFVIPGNHERGSIPYPLLASHPGIRIFDRPRTFAVEASGTRMALSGFPFQRTGVREKFSALLQRTGWRDEEAQVRFLCMHQAVEGARVGAQEFTFRSGPDVVPGSLVPGGFCAVLSGHIHRHQVLLRDLAGRRLACPVIYPGSVERTSFAERNEDKGYVIIEVESDGRAGRLSSCRFVPLPARPMRDVALHVDGMDFEPLGERIRDIVSRQPRDAILRLVVAGTLRPGAERALRAAFLRDLVPKTMNIQVKFADQKIITKTLNKK